MNPLALSPRIVGRQPAARDEPCAEPAAASFGEAASRLPARTPGSGATPVADNRSPRWKMRYPRQREVVMGIRYAKPPVLLRDVIDDVSEVVRLLESQAPYGPLGGWYNPGADPHARTRPMWFQHDWVHDTFHAEGSDLFLQHPLYIEEAKRFYDAEVVEPQSVYVNLMTSIADGGPAHTDNPRFRGRDRTNTPMWLLRAMLWSGLFERFEIRQATAIWWMNDVEGGGLSYWADGPESPPRHHVGSMANTALIGDNHGMFHQVEPVGPFDLGTRRVTPSAKLAPVGDDSGDWAVIDHGELIMRAPLEAFRVSVLWKADVYTSAAEREARANDLLTMDAVAATFNDDLASRGSSVQFDLTRLEDPSMKAELATVYPEAVPVGALRSVFAYA
jgi:hypothetical protein